MKLWKGRFTKEENSFADEFNSSIDVDCRMWSQDIKGSIEPGKLADLVVLSENILETPLERIKSVKADMTILDGEVVYEREL